MSAGTILYGPHGQLSHLIGLSPEEVEEALSRGVWEGKPFVYLAPEGKPPKSIFVNPKLVVAGVRWDPADYA